MELPYENHLLKIAPPFQQRSSPKGNDRSPVSNVQRSNIISKNI